MTNENENETTDIAQLSRLAAHQEGPAFQCSHPECEADAAWAFTPRGRAVAEAWCCDAHVKEGRELTGQISGTWNSLRDDSHVERDQDFAGLASLTSVVAAMERMHKLELHRCAMFGHPHKVAEHRARAEVWAKCAELCAGVLAGQSVTRTTWAELDEACAPIDGVAGVPQLIAVVSGLLPGEAQLPASWGDWIGRQIERRGTVEFSCATDDGTAWRVEIR